MCHEEYTDFLEDEALNLVRLHQFYERPRLQVEDPNRISITNIFVLLLFGTLVQSDRNLLFFLF